MKISLADFCNRRLTDENLIYLAFLSVFLPYYITAVFLIAIPVYLFFTHRLDGLFRKNSTVWIIVFTIYSAIVAACNLNLIGVICSIGFFLLMIILLYTRQRFTVHSFERGLDICCIAGTVTSLLCFAEYAWNMLHPVQSGIYRCRLYFFNCNYLATVLATVIIICGYKVLSGRRRKMWYYAAAVFCAFGAYLTGSLLVWVEVLIGMAALLLLMRKHQMLSILLLLAGTACIVLYCVPELLPRIQDSNITTDNRVVIWRTSLQAIAKSPIFGRGFLTYYHIYSDFPGSYPTTHAHNILLEPILSFGIVGTALMLIPLIYYYRRVILCRNAQNKLNATSLILALSCALVIHGTTDLTFMWIQTGLLYCLIMGGVGIEERMLKID